MDKRNQVKIHTLSDSLEARLKARRLARELGFTLQDQAYISLATWELAVQLSLGISRQGTIHINPIKAQDERQGIRIVCGTKSISDADLKTIISGEVKSLVDELTIEKPSSNGNIVEIVATKWKD